MKKILIVLDEPFTDPVRGVSYPAGLAEVEERYEKRSRIHGLKFRYPTEEETAAFRERARASRKRASPSTEPSTPDATNHTQQGENP